MKSQGLDEPIVKSEDKYGKGGATQAITKSEIKNDVNEKEKMVNKNRIKLLLILCLSLNISSYFLMAQDIVIRDTVVNHYVFGNGDAGDNGNGTFDTIVLASQNNSVTILGIAGVGIIAGAIDRPEITEDVRSNSLVIDISTSVTDLRCGTTADVCGGIGRNSGSNAIENILRINNGDIQRDAFGGISLLGEAKNNKVIISGGVLRGDIGGGATQDSNANENKVIISGGEILGNIYGGMSGDGGAVGNTVEISGGEFLGNIYGGISRDGGAVGNTVEISGGEFLDNIYGGRSRDGGAVGNTVEISGGEFFADVYGGKSRDGGAVGNTVEISGDPKFSTNTFIYGGFTSTASVADVFTNNTLNIKTNNIEVKGIRNFQFLNFYNLIKNGNAMLTCAQQVNIEGVNINVEMNIDEDVGVNDKYILIRGIGGFDGVSKEIKVKQGVLNRYDASILTNNSIDLGIVITDEYINNRAEIITQSKAATLEIISEGLDLIVDKGIESAKEVSADVEGLVPFVAVKGGKSKISTGADINIEGIGVMGGVAKEINKEGNKVTIGGFVEYGRKTSKLSEKIDFDKISADLTGDYKGLGVLIRSDIFTNSYIEGSARVGGYSVDFNADNIDQEKEERVSYDYNSMYLGGHAGVGYIYKLNDRVNIDMSSKFLFMHQQEKELKLSSGDNLKFLNLESGKVRVGTTLDYKLPKQWWPYIGINYDYEVIGKKVEAKAIDIDLPAVEVSRGRFSGQLGIKKEIGKFNINGSVVGYAGSKEGIDAMFKVKFYL